MKNKLFTVKSAWISKYHISQCEVFTNIVIKQNLTFPQFAQLYQETNPKTKQLKYINNYNLRIIIQYGASFFLCFWSLRNLYNISLQLCIAANRILFVSNVINLRKKRNWPFLARVHISDQFSPLSHG